MVQTLTIMRGVSGSGKSTEAQRIAAETNAIVISRDLIRLALYDDPRQGEEAVVAAMMTAMVEAALWLGRDVVVDDINLRWEDVARWEAIGIKRYAKVVLKPIDTPLETCLLNNAKRAFMGGRHVPEEIIKKQHRRFQETKDWII